MKNALAFKHLAESLVLPMVDIDKGLKSIYLSPRPVNNPHELPLARHAEISELSRSQAEQRQTQLDVSRQCPPVEDACPAHAQGRRATQELRDQRGSRGHTLPHDSLERVFSPPPPPLEASRGGQRYMVEQLLNHRDVNGRRTSYLVRWRGHPPSWDTWEPRSQLMIDVLGMVEQYDAAHPVLQKDRRRKSSRHGRKGIQAVNPFVHLSRDTYTPPRASKEVGLLRCARRVVYTTRARVSPGETG
uniref:Chromo domain-containing protein n=1 Tax=Peronospora matthiolae TaxID=2874970 RepID=A0AAV1SZS5_9STRA